LTDTQAGVIVHRNIVALHHDRQPEEEIPMNTMKENLSLYQEAAKQGYDNVRQLGDLNLAVWNRMLDRQVDAFGLWLDAGTRQMELLSTSKSYQEYLGAQAKLSRELVEGLTQQGRITLDSVGEAREEYRSWVEKSLSSATEKWSQAAAPKN
jgi:hypothetical protein